MWGIRGQEVTPPNLSAVYFIYLPTSAKCLYTNMDLNDWTTPMTNWGDIQQLANMHMDCPLIPIDPHLALSLNWVTIDEMAGEMPYINDNIKACLRLIKDIKEEGSGNDKEGLSTSS